MAGNGRQKREVILLSALAGGATVTSAAKQAGISERTAYRRLKDPDFQHQLQLAQGEMLAEAVRRLTSGMQLAANTLMKLLEAESPAIQLRAALAILDLGPKLSQMLQLESRLAELEQRVAQSDSSGLSSLDPSALKLIRY